MKQKFNSQKMRQWGYIFTIFAFIMAIIVLGSTLFGTDNNLQAVEEPNLPNTTYVDPKITEEKSFKKTYGKELTLVKSEMEAMKAQLEEYKRDKEKRQKEQGKDLNFLGEEVNPKELGFQVPSPDEAIDGEQPKEPKVATVTYELQSDGIIISSEPTSSNSTSDQTPVINDVVNGANTDVTNKDETPNQSNDNQQDPQQDQSADGIKILAGSFSKGILLNGLDAPTSSNARNDFPHPVMIKLVGKAISPNGFTVDIKSCVANGVGYGELSSNRAIIRVDGMTCYTEDGTALEANTKSFAYVTGEDGKIGLEGTPVSKQGAMIARAMGAEILSSFGGILEQTSQPEVAIAGNGTTVTPNIKMKEALKQGAFAGFNGASQTIKDIYLKLNDQMFPVIEIAIGRECDLMFNKTITLTEVK